MFAALLFVFQVGPDSVSYGLVRRVTADGVAVALVVRTRRPFYRSRPGNVLLVSTVVLVPVALILPYFPFVGALGFVPMPASLVATICGITLAYLVATRQPRSGSIGGRGQFRACTGFLRWPAGLSELRAALDRRPDAAPNAECLTSSIRCVVTPGCGISRDDTILGAVEARERPACPNRP